MREEAKTRVLIIDDSALVRRALSSTLEAEPDIEVAGTAPDAIIGLAKIASLKPDVITLDLEMPGMDGLTFLRQLMRESPLPVVVISSLGQSGSRAAVEALHMGAIEVLPKPAGPYSVGDLKVQLPNKIRAAARARLGRQSRASWSPGATAAPPLASPQPPARALNDAPALIAIGASTGGTDAIRVLLSGMPANCPPIVIVQHIPAGFSRAFAERLDASCAMEVKEAEDGDAIRPGRALIAPGNYHLTVTGHRDGYRAAVAAGEMVCYQRPSVDVLLSSVARMVGGRATGVILTGMGSDGAQGLLAMRRAGSRTIAQDEESCVVFGMPKEAIRLEAATEIVPLDQIARALLSGRAVAA